MDALHFHLIANHTPIVLTGAGLVLGLWGFFAKDKGLQVGAMCLLLGAAIIAFFVNASGHGAEEMVEDLPGFSHRLIHEHEEVAEKGFYMSVVVGIMALVSWIRIRKNLARARTLVLITLISCLASLATMSYAGLLGGTIAHKELTPGDRAAVEKPLHEAEEEAHEAQERE